VERLQTRGIRPPAPYDLGTPWADNRLPSTDELSGREIALTRDDGTTIAFSFEGTTVRWRPAHGGVDQSSEYDAVAIRDQTYFIQFLHADRRSATSIALNMRSQGGVLVTNTLIHGENKTDLQQDLYPFAIAGSGAELPGLTGELVGRRAYAEYADGHTAEHVYFNPRRFAWQGLGRFDYSGSECDNSTTWKLDEQLYLLTWVEEWQAVGAVLMMDFAALRNVGVLFGQDDNGLVHTLVGARLHILNELTYPPGYEPAGMAGTT